MDDPRLLATAAGGLGLFLLGMVIMTEGLRAAAGDAIRRSLVRFTHSPLSGAVTGAIATAILQSSSATTVAAVGFVSAGLLTFPQALGIVFGANIGTTVTGWLVALLGFKLQLGVVLLPLVLAGALVKLFSTGKRAAFGYGLAGFGLIFVGIDFMQTGMSGFDTIISAERLPADSLGGRLLLVALGMLATVITQSSSAGVATTLTLLFADMINFHQAAALVIGMDIGTTFTALLATIGGSTGARRTGLSHVLYNFMTAAMALLLIDPYVAAWDQLLPGAINNQAEIALVAFHTVFNTVGVILIIPFARPFARLIMRLVPERQPAWSGGLEPGLLEQPALAMDAGQAVIRDLFGMLFTHVHLLLQGQPGSADLARLQVALDEVERYLDHVHLSASTQPADQARLVGLLHALDHLQRLHERCEEDEDRASTARTAPRLAGIHSDLLVELERLRSDIAAGHWHHATGHMAGVAAQLNTAGDALRRRILADTASGELTLPESTARLEAVRWLVRISHHLARVTHHLDNATDAAGRTDD